MFDYLDWRGDLSFENAPINAVDLLIFAMLIVTGIAIGKNTWKSVLL